MINISLLSTQTASKSMRSMISILNKAQSWALEKEISEDDVLTARLAPDMLPFANQIRIMSDNAKGMASRLSGVENPVMTDNETNIYQLIERLERTIEFVDAIPAESFEYADTAKIILPRTPEGKYLTAEAYLRDYGLPNFFFHKVTAYAILRNLGMPLGKMDYINEINFEDLE
jgi:hypothetical protein